MPTTIEDLSKRLSLIEEKQQLLERVTSQDQTVLATAILQTLKEEHLVKEIIRRTAEAIEAEWSGKFLPELRRTLKETSLQDGR